VAVIKLLTSHQHWFTLEPPGPRSRAYHILETLLKDSQVQQFLQVNRYQGVLWFKQESFEQLQWWLLLLAVVKIGTDPLRPVTERAQELLACYEIIQQLNRAEAKSGYQIEKLLTAV